jgi:nucleotide-binding universal stress UspA family protein
MTTIRRILCPVDFSDFSRRALDHAVAVAKWYGAEIVVMYVHHVPLAAIAPLGGLGATPVEPVGLLPQDRKTLEDQLAAFAPEPARGMAVRCRVGEGDVATEILAEAASADLVVMGTHGRAGFEHLVLGSVTEKVLRKARCSLLTIPRAAPGTAKPVPRMFHHVVAAVDFSDVSGKALEHATSLAEEADAQLTVLHVVDLPEHPALWIDRPDGASHVRDMREAAAVRLRAAVPDDVRRSCHIEERVEAGAPYREILRVAAERRAGLIVIGAHGRGGVERMFVGSTAQHVVRQAVCPVLTVRERES